MCAYAWVQMSLETIRILWLELQAVISIHVLNHGTISTVPTWCFIFPSFITYFLTLACYILNTLMYYKPKVWLSGWFSKPKRTIIFLNTYTAPFPIKTILVAFSQNSAIPLNNCYLPTDGFKTIFHFLNITKSTKSSSNDSSFHTPHKKHSSKFSSTPFSVNLWYILSLYTYMYTCMPHDWWYE